jgi:hypothetical protein
VTTKTIFLTDVTLSSFTLPADFSSNNTVECYGAGDDGISSNATSSTTANSGPGGHGGDYSIVSNFAWTAGQTISLSVGSHGPIGGDTWVSSVANTPPTSTAQGVLAPGGSSATTAIGTTSNAGGAGGTSSATSGFGGGGGGGCGGPNGVGQVGSNGIAGKGGNAGGADGVTTGGSANSGVTPAAGSCKGGGGGFTSGASGANGTNHAIYAGSNLGPGGGGGGGGGNSGNPGFGAIGGGGGGAGQAGGAGQVWPGSAGGNGLIVITYTPLVALGVAVRSVSVS